MDVWLIESGRVEFIQQDGKRLTSLELGGQVELKAA